MNDLGQDLLKGAKEIGAFLKLKPRQVYHLAERGEVPIHTVPGIGMCARKSALQAYFDALDAPFLRVEKQDAAA